METKEWVIAFLSLSENHAIPFLPSQEVVCLRLAGRSFERDRRALLGAD
jgi:hypothetical protein